MNKVHWRRIVFGCGAAATLLLCGCRHYAVTDTGTGATYYTKRVNHDHKGVATFTDRRTGHEVTVRSAEVKEISKREYKDALEK